jgi:peptide/nickel transport system substrate-binding protein
MPVMGAWVPVEYRPDDIIVMRRNPYYWKVDEKGNQLPLSQRTALQAVDLGRP